MARLISLYFPPSSTTALLPTTVAGGGAGSIPLANPYPILFPDLTRSITFTSTDDLSAITFVIGGKDQFGNMISESLAGPNNTTVTSAKLYNSITNIVASGNWTNFSIGTGATGTFQWIKLNTLISPPYTTIAVEIAGTITYSVNQTLDNIEPYLEVGPSFIGNYPKVNELEDTAFATVNGSKVVTVTVPSTAGLVNGDIVTFTGATVSGGIDPTLLNITAPITVISATEITYQAGANGNGGSGGGPNAAYYFPALPTSFAVTGALTGATSNQIYNLNSSATALQGLVTASTGGSLTLNILQAGIN